VARERLAPLKDDAELVVEEFHGASTVSIPALAIGIPKKAGRDFKQMRGERRGWRPLLH
jgi:hypothetical protein